MSSRPRSNRPSALASGDTGQRLSGLRFPSNDEAPAAPFVAIQFDAPQNNGLPLWGPSGQGTTWIWEIIPRQHTGFYVTFWHSQGDGNFNGTNGYYGSHPYPPTGGSLGTAHDWEIAIRANDYTLNRNGVPVSVVKDVKYVQALRVQRTNANSKTLIFYIDLPSVDNSKVIERVETVVDYGETTAPSPKVTFGDSPWYATFQHERLSGVLGRIKIFNKLLSEADVVSEAADMTKLVTSEGSANIWWGKNNFTSADDLTCNYGTGRAFVWADASNKATLAPI